MIQTLSITFSKSDLEDLAKQYMLHGKPLRPIDVEFTFSWHPDGGLGVSMEIIGGAKL